MGWLDRIRGVEAMGDNAAPDSARALRDRGNALRDQRLWAEAATAFAAYLELRPDDRGITVQHGHMVKESGDAAAALSIYRQAEAMEPDDPDIHLQIGHALKLLNRLPEAAVAYARAAMLDAILESGPSDGWRELVGLQQAGVALPWRADGAPQTPPAVLLDIGDLLAWAAGRRAPSGIQRVQLAIGAAVLDAGLDAALIAPRAEGGGFCAVPALWFRRLHELMRQGADADAPAFGQMRDAIAAVLTGPALDFASHDGRGQVLLTLGTAWTRPGYFGAIAAARRPSGLRHVALVHDMGPMLSPTDASPGLSAQFTRWFAGLTRHADGVIVTTEETARDVARIATDLGQDAILPCAIVPLDAAPDLPPPASDHPVLDDPRPFVAWVASLEPRKDHAFVFTAWSALAERLGPATPRLVCAGRITEGAAAALAMLQADPRLGALVTVIPDADDALVAALLTRARFALYHSRHEGWGLPVTEALALGKPLVMPDLPGLRAAGRGLADTFPPGDMAALVALLERLATDDAALAESAARIAAAAPLRRWTDIAADLLAGALALGHAGRVLSSAIPAVPLGTSLHFGSGEADDSLLSQHLAETLRDPEGWHGVETWGCWSRPGTALLRLNPAGAEGRPLRLLLDLRAPPGGEALVDAAADRDDAPGAWQRLRLPDAPTCRVVLEVPAGQGPITLRLDAPGGASRPDGREVGFGLVALTLAAADDAEARLALLEREAFTLLTLA
ncbi:glycosyltransferase [Humitalea sp. 24SJ18S-53]|uniref:glycosyltransferase n=1 Tax=Humitalea sp. 24SJ18S-53 TaxID=3422307 RepID=UPI003D66F5E8